MGGFGGARKSQHGGIYLDTLNNISARRDAKYFGIKSALRGKDGFNWN